MRGDKNYDRNSRVKKSMNNAFSAKTAMSGMILNNFGNIGEKFLKILYHIFLVFNEYKYLKYIIKYCFYFSI